MGRYLADTLVVSLGFLLAFTFFSPWLPDTGFGLTAYEPNTAVRIGEGLVGVLILLFGVYRVKTDLRA